MLSITARIAKDLDVKSTQVEATVKLLDDGDSVPFIARYRKEATAGLDDTQLRDLAEKLTYYRELETRRETIIKSIKEQDKLTPELAKAIAEAETKTSLEDIYLPYKPKRQTKAQIARAAGLEPLADALLSDPSLQPEEAAGAYVDADAGVADATAALDGAQQILMERFSEDAQLVGKLRAEFQDNAVLSSRVAKDKESEGDKFRDYFEYQETIKTVPSHRALALFRGRNEGILWLKVDLAEEKLPVTPSDDHPCEGVIARHFDVSNQDRPADAWLRKCVRWTWRIKIQPRLELDLLNELREVAEADAIGVFAANLKDLMLAAPAGARATMGLDPGLRTGVKVAVVDHTGKLVDHATIYPHVPKNDWQGSLITLAKLTKKHNVKLISVGNGTASRETDKLAAELTKLQPELGLTRVMVSEAGASVYSASAFAAKEFPDLDVTIRGAVSIARRLQDPLAELVKIEPKAIGVGQYQHDVSQLKLAKSLDAAVEDCVNQVGVDLNIASAALLARVSGLSSSLADNIVSHRDANGAFANRNALKEVPRLGDKTFEQAAGFLRISGGENPLDGSSVHPESYDLVTEIANHVGKDIAQLIGDKTTLQSVNADQFTSERFGLPTVKDILQELEKPGRDPRPQFTTAKFTDGVETISDLDAGMILEGTVSNVANFGAFVDIGVHQDGLVHISALAKKFVDDPRDVVRAGDVVKVKVLSVEVKRKRIALTMRLDDPLPDESEQPMQRSAAPRSSKPEHKGRPPQQNRQQGSGQDHRQHHGQRHNQQQGAKSGGRSSNNQLAEQLAALKRK